MPSLRPAVTASAGERGVVFCSGILGNTVRDTSKQRDSYGRCDELIIVQDELDCKHSKFASLGERQGSVGVLCRGMGIQGAFMLVSFEALSRQDEKSWLENEHEHGPRLDMLVSTPFLYRAKWRIVPFTK